MAAPPVFPEIELERALAEQSFGLKTYKVTDNASELEASAQVQLLEGQWIRLSLTTQGYQLHGRDGGTRDFYETVENALEVVSPLYSKAKQTILFEKLAALENAQTDTSSHF